MKAAARVEVARRDGRDVVVDMMDRAGHTGLTVVPEQAEPDGTFLLAFLEDGKVADVETTPPIVFESQDGRATRWYARTEKGIGDKPWVFGSRRP